MNSSESFLKILSLNNPHQIAINVIMCLIGLLISFLLLELYFKLDFDKPISNFKDLLVAGLRVLAIFNIVLIMVACFISSFIILFCYLGLGVASICIYVFNLVYGIVHAVVYFLF